MGISGRIARAFLQSQLTPLIALVALLLGTFAVIVTPKEEEPQINVTMANVFIPFPGASAKDVETLVATPAEQVLSQVQGLEHVYSVSRPGVAILTVQYKVGVGREAALVRLWDAIHANRDWVSAQLGVGEPIIKAKGIDDVPIVALTLSTADSERGAFDLERVAHAMEVELKRVSGTREVTSIGGPGRKVRVLLDADKLSAYNVSPLEIQNALQLSNVALPSGNLVSNNQQIEIQTGNWLENARDVAATEWKATKKSLTTEVELCRDEVHELATQYREGAREEEVEVDERVKGDVIQTFIVGSKPVKVIRERPLESGDQTTIDDGDDDADTPEEESL